MNEHINQRVSDDDERLVLVVAGNLFLKTRHPSDAEQLLVLVDKNRSFLRPWLPWVDATTSLQDSKKYIEECITDLVKGVKVDFSIWYQGTLVGSIGLFDIDKTHRSAEIGYWLDQAHTGNGIMTKCVERLIAYGFDELNLNRIRIRCDVGNAQSAHVAERLGFTREGVHRQAHWVHDKFVDDVIYGLLRSEWQK